MNKTFHASLTHLLVNGMFEPDMKITTIQGKKEKKNRPETKKRKKCNAGVCFLEYEHTLTPRLFSYITSVSGRTVKRSLVLQVSLPPLFSRGPSVRQRDNFYSPGDGQSQSRITYAYSPVSQRPSKAHMETSAWPRHRLAR